MQEDHFTIDAMHVAVPRAADIDVHKMEVTASVRLCEPGQPDASMATRTFGTHPSALRDLTDWLHGQRVEAATMEGTGIYWIAPFRALEEAGIRPTLVHAQHVQQIKGRKTDCQDSIWLARVCQFGLARPSHVPPRAFAELRQQCRYRRQLVANRARVRNRLQKTLDQDGLRLGGVLTDLFGVNGRHVLDGLVQGVAVESILAGLTRHVRGKLRLLAQTLEANLSPASLWMLAGQLDDFDAVTGRILELDERVEAAMADWRRSLDLLETIPGIARSSAHAILAELGPEPTQVCATAARLAAWAGVCPGNNESAGKRRSGRVRAGNPTLRATLTECAHGAARTKDSQFHGFHATMTARHGYKRAILATAHKLLRTVYAVLRDDRPYQAPQVDYEQLLAQRNGPRWIRMLHKHDLLEELLPAA